MKVEFRPEKTPVKESTTSRIYTRLTDGTTCAIISAFRGDNSYAENMKLHKELKSDVRGLYLGFNEFISRWVEDGVSYDERSLLIPNIRKVTALELGKRYGQSSIIYKDYNGCVEICITPFENYQSGDIVRTYNISGDKVLNVNDAQEIFARRKGGPASMPVKGSNTKPFTLRTVESFELYEVLNPKPSYFQTEERTIKLL